MAENTNPTNPNPTNQPAAPEEAGSRQSPFHYYAGGEVKELAKTRISPALYWVWGLVVLGAVFFFLTGGALGPKFGGYQPQGNSAANQEALRAELNMGAGVQLTSLDLNQLPRPAGQTVEQAKNAGSQIYQTYCFGCHGPNQDGNGVNAASLNPKPRNLHDAPFMQAMSYQRIWTSLHKGVYGTAMPRWENTLSDKNFQDVIVYVFSLTAPTGPAPIEGASSGGVSQFNNGIQNVPKPITPPVNGNPAAPTSTAPPSTSGGSPTTNGGAPDAGGQSVNPPLRLKPATSTPGSSTPPAGGGSSTSGGSM